MKSKDQYLITLVGVRQAQIGYAFIHQGSSSCCEGCKYFRICIQNLEVGRIYRIVGLRENIFQCENHETGVRVVEVTESDIYTIIPHKQAVKGAVITFHPQSCDVQSCENHNLCVPRGLFEGDRCFLLEIGESVVCFNGLSLVKVALRPLLTF